MEIEGNVNHKKVSRMLNGQNCNVLIKAPDIFHKLLSLTLSGWTYKQPIVDDYFELGVSLQNGKYHITSNLAYAPTPRSDLIDTLNEILLCLCYLLTAKNPDGLLIHCAAFCEKDRNNVILASKKSGKSSLVLDKSQQGVSILADDLAIWFPMQGRLMCLGLPIRMRRPIPAEFHLKRQDFIAGKNIAYSKSTSVNCFQVGHLFVPDKLMTLNNRVTKSISFWRWPSMLNAFAIDDTYSQLK